LVDLKLYLDNNLLQPETNDQNYVQLGYSEIPIWWSYKFYLWLS